MEDSSSRTWRPRNTHSKQRGLLWLSPQAKSASLSHVKWKFVALVVSTISVYQARKKVLTFFRIFYYESQRGRNLFNTKIWSPSYLQSWLRDPGLIRLLPDLESDKSGAGLVRHACPQKASENIHSPGQASRAPCLLAICGPWSQSDQAWGGFEGGGCSVGVSRSHSGPTPEDCSLLLTPASSSLLSLLKSWIRRLCFSSHIWEGWAP